MINENIFQFPILYANASIMGKIAVGWGAYKTVGDECKAAGIKKALIVTTGLKGTGIVDEIKGILEYHGISTEIFNKLTSNPKDYEVMAGYEVFKKAQCDGVVSVGGGSSHDCGKGVRVVAANNGEHVTEFMGSTDPDWQKKAAKFKPCSAPQIAVNTTTGTGAENSMGAACTDTTTKVKRMAIVPNVCPQLAINDPLLARCQPPRIAAQTSWDAFTHAFELYVSPIQSDYSLALAYRSIKLIAENLREFVYNRMNAEACKSIVWASTLSGGFGLNSGGGIGIVHGLMHGLSAMYDSHHGLVNAAFTIPGERYNQSACPERFAEMAQAMGVDTRGMTKVEASDAWFEEVERLLADLNFETGNLSKQFGLRKEDIPHIIKEQYEGGFMAQGNPRNYDYDEVVALFESQL